VKPLYLSGYGIAMSVDSGRLVVRDGRDLRKEPIQTVLKPGDDGDIHWPPQGLSEVETNRALLFVIS